MSENNREVLLSQINSGKFLFYLFIFMEYLADLHDNPYRERKKKKIDFDVPGLR